MKLTFTPSAWTDYLWFQEHDRKLLKRINLLIQDALRTPFEGIGKPELLRPSPAIGERGRPTGPTAARRPWAEPAR